MPLKWVAAVVACGALGVAGFAFAATTEVTLGSGGPSPGDVTIAWGDTLSFYNADGETHTVTSRLQGWPTLTIAPGQRASFPFLGTPGPVAYTQVGSRKRYNGRVTVTLNGKLTIKSNKPTVAYGQTLVLSGTNTLVTQPVAIQRRTLDAQKQAPWEDVTTLPATPDGSFSTAIKAVSGYIYRATTANGNLLSDNLVVGVRPLVRLTITKRATQAGRTLNAIARVTPADSVTDISLTRFARGKWKSIARARVASNGVAKLRFPVDAGKVLVRAEIRPEKKSGFAASTSKAVAVTGTGGDPRRRGR